MPQLGIDSTGENTFNLLDKQLKKHELSSQRHSAFCTGNASVNLGQCKGVNAFVLKDNDKIFMHGCTCHLIHLTALHAARELITVLFNL